MSHQFVPTYAVQPAGSKVTRCIFAVALLAHSLAVSAREVPLSPMDIPDSPGSSVGQGLGMIESAPLYGNLNKYAYYFTDLLIGSPIPQRTSVIVDTGSRIAGFPCSGCKHCGNHIDAPFDMNRSASAQWLKCGTDCTQGCVNGHCTYKETYSEGSSIIGRWFDDVVQLGGEKKNPSVHARLGCHNWVDKLFYTQRANGIMGLAPASDNVGASSTPTVLQDLFRDRAHISTKVFSLCLASWGGRLTVGGYSTWYHEDHVHWMPMRASKYYFAFPDTLSFLTEDESDSFVMHGDFGVTIVDSGTTYTYFPRPLFNNVVSSLTRYCQEHDGCGATREGSECWRLDDEAYGPDLFPTIRFHFQGGTNVDWSPRGYLHERGIQGVWCQTFMENNLYQTVLGISWMLHKDVIFDLATSRLGVAKANCPEHHRDADEEAEAAVQRKFERPTWEVAVTAPEVSRSRGNLITSWSTCACSVIAAAALVALAALRQRLPRTSAESAATLKKEGEPLVAVDASLCTE